MSEERTVKGAVDVYLERLDRLVTEGIDLRTAKAGAMVVALVWLGVEQERERYQPKIEEELAKRRAALISPANRKTGGNGTR